MTFVSGDMRLKSVQAQKSRANIVWAVWFTGILGITAVIGLLMLLIGPHFAFVAWILFVVGAVAILFRPRYGVYLIIFFSLVGDARMMDWYPFNKNFSSIESLLYLNDSIIISPLEVYLVITLISWLGQSLIQRKLKFHKGPLFWPIIAFFAFIIIGLVYGIGTGGNINIALWEARPMFYLPIMFILVSNLFTKRRQINYLMWTVMIALFIEGLIGTHYYFVILGGDLSSVQGITEHSAAIHMNSLFIFILAAWLYAGSWSKRFLLPIMALPVLFSYIASQRRAAFVALAVALAFMTIFLYKENQKAFWLITPTAMVLGIAYLGIFWNNTGAIGLPAQAIKSVVAEDQASAQDRSSNVYREIENINASYTIHQSPLMGVGFGQPFYFFVPLPDISFFVWWEYITHNSIAWIWMKMGVGGFMVMMVLVGMSIMVGVRVLWRVPRDDMSAITLTVLLYIVMHFIYAYVDMSWEAQNMVYVGVSMGIINSLERIVAQPTPIKPKRWPWQPDTSPPPGLKPLFVE